MMDARTEWMVKPVKFLETALFNFGACTVGALAVYWMTGKFPVEVLTYFGIGYSISWATLIAITERMPDGR